MATALMPKKVKSNASRAAVGATRRNTVIESLSQSRTLARSTAPTNKVLSKSLDLGSRKAFKGSDAPKHKSIEEEYIKNLQQQIYFLELEAEYLRGQLTKNAEKDPSNLLEENASLSKEIKMLKHEVGIKGRELLQKESNLQHLEKEFQIAMDNVKASKDSNEAEKKELLGEIVQLKQQLDQEVFQSSKKESSLRGYEREAKESASTLHTAESRIKALREELDGNTNRCNAVRVQLEEKRVECMKLQTQVAALEEQLFSSKASMDEELCKELKLEVKNLKYEIRHKEMTVKQDRDFRAKMADDCMALVKENASLAAQVIELQKTLDLEREHQEERSKRKQSNLQELVELRDNEKQLQRDLADCRHQLQEEQARHKTMLSKLSTEEFNSAQADATLSKLSDDMERLEHLRIEQADANADLKRDKALLGNELDDLYVQLDTKDNELESLRGQLEDYKTQCREMSAKLRMQNSIDSIKWDEMEKMADSMKAFSQHMAPLHRSIDFD